jgi:hypothetical protein
MPCRPSLRRRIGKRSRFSGLALSESGSLRSGRDADSVLYAGELRQLWQKQMAMPAKP